MQALSCHCPSVSRSFSLQYVLDHLEERWRDEEDTFAGSLREYDAQLADSCSSLWTECYDTVAEMEEEALGMPPEMRDIHARLVDLQRRLQEMLERDHSSAEVDAVVAELNEIHVLQMEGDGVFVGDIEAPPPGWTVCSELLGLGYELASQAARTAHDEPRELVATADALRGMRNDLKKLMGQKVRAA